MPKHAALRPPLVWIDGGLKDASKEERTDTRTRIEDVRASGRAEERSGEGGRTGRRSDGPCAPQFLNIGKSAWAVG